MDSNLSELVLNCSSGSGVVGASFISLVGNKPTYKIKQNKLSTFIEGYCGLAAADEEEGDYKKQKQLYLAEVVDRKTLPVFGIFTLKFENLSEYASIFDETFLVEVARCFQLAMGELIEISAELNELICCVEESTPWKMGNHTSIQVKWQFPYCQVDIEYQKKHLRPKLLTLLRSRKIMSYLEVEPIGDWNDILQPITNNFPLYRSSSELGRPHMTLTHIYYALGEEEEKSQPQDFIDDLDKVFKPENHSYIIQNKITPDFVEKDDIDVKFWLPLFLSINFWTREANIKIVEQDTHGDGHKFENIDTDDPLEIASHLLPLLGPHRIKEEHYWLDVGRALYNITKGSEIGLNKWIAFSSRATIEGRDERSCRMKYNRIVQGIICHQYISVKTIAWFAKEDNPAAYAAWHDSWCHNTFENGISGLHEDVAKAVYRYFWLDYLCTGMTKATWWRFVDTCFKPMDDAVDLRKNISTKFIPVYIKMIADFSRKMFEDLQSADSKKKELEIQVQNIAKLITKLKTESYKTTLLKACRQQFYTIDIFSKIINKDPEKLACTNNVIELCDGKANVRPGKPEDYITITTGIAYETFSWEDPLVKELMEWLRQVFVDRELLDYFLKDAASFLRAKNAEKRFRIWTGMGNNSKSMILKLFKYALGQKCVDFPLDVICGKKGFASNGPSPELSQAEGSNAAFLSEPEGDEEMRTGAIKRYTGGDSFFTRACNENGGSIEAFFKLVLMCNRIPDFTMIDTALRDRIDILPFLSTWSDDAPDDEKEQYRLRIFKKDPFFEKRLPELSYAFLWVMVQYFPSYSVSGLKRPEIVRKKIQEHMEENDTYRMFIEDKLTPVYKVDGEKKIIDESVSVTPTELYGSFKIWFRDAHPTGKVIDKPKFIEEMSMTNRLGPRGGVRRGWIGLKIIVPIAANAGIFQQ